MNIVFKTKDYGELHYDGTVVKQFTKKVTGFSIVDPEGIFTWNARSYKIEGDTLWGYVGDGKRDRRTEFVNSLAKATGMELFAGFLNMKFSEAIEKLVVRGVTLVKNEGPTTLSWSFNHPKLGTLRYDADCGLIDAHGHPVEGCKVRHIFNGKADLWEFVCKGVDNRVQEFKDNLAALTGLNIGDFMDMKFTDVVDGLAMYGLKAEKKCAPQECNKQN